MTPFNPEDYEPPRLELVMKQPEWWVAWDRKFGSYWFFDSEHTPGARFGTPTPDEKMWKPEFERRFGVYDGRESPYLVYDIDGQWHHWSSGEMRDYKTHIAQDGDCICNVSSPVSPDDTDQLRPVSELDEEEYEAMEMFACANCTSALPSSTRDD